MATVHDSLHRLEPDPSATDPSRGFTAEVADPAWLLGRQWQLGEHTGEDASSPVTVTYEVHLGRILPDHDNTPAESYVESEPADFWTIGRRVAAGRLVTSATGRTFPTDLLLADLPEPYDALNGQTPDGKLLWEHRTQLALPASAFGPVRPADPEPEDLWNPSEFSYDADLPADGTELRLRRHDGGDLDWFSADATTTTTAPGEPATRTVIPGRLRHPAAPLPRWWQIEDAHTDPGGQGPDRSHLATLLLLDLVVHQSDDWFAFPVDALSGHLATLTTVTVTDSFGRTWPLTPPTDGWTLFTTTGLPRETIVLWPTTVAPLEGPVQDEITLGVDEDANLLWAVERRLSGRDIPTPADPPPAPPETLDTSARAPYTYALSSRVPPRWSPYTIEEVAGQRRYVQGRAADYSGPQPTLLPEPESDLLIVSPTHPVHEIAPSAIPSTGLRLIRRPMLARRPDGDPVLWTQRRRTPLTTPPALPLRFDTLT